MTYHIVVQKVTSVSIPSNKELKQWAKTALEKRIASAEVTLRIVDKDEIRQLNLTYRQKDKPTNVLSFPFDIPKDIGMEIPILGDIIICADIVKEEAHEQGKTEKAHFAHMLVHGILHLLGYDHEKDQEAELMEKEEIVILHSLGFSNPYETTKGYSHE